MTAPTMVSPDHITRTLQRLCRQPSVAGQTNDLARMAHVVADTLRHASLDVKIVRTAGAPVVLGWYTGRSPFTLLLYHHYDVAPPGPWRVWSHEPFQLAEREHALYGRGVAHGKGPLAAHLRAVRTCIEREGGLPCNLVVVVEGESLSGSPHLGDVLAAHADTLRADACLASGGTRDPQGLPFCYSGSKGLLQVRLTANGPSQPLDAGFAGSVRNPLWQMVWALGHIKGDDEDIRINGFYDDVEGPSRVENTALRKVRLAEAKRLETWQLPEFLFELSGVALTRTETTLPTCNLSAFAVEPAHSVTAIPMQVTAQLDFQLVPQQHPNTMFNLLREHLIARKCLDIKLEQLPGGYPPARTEPETPFVQHVVAAGQTIFDTALTLLPLGPFVQPLHMFGEQLNIPVAAVGLAREDSAVYGANERIPINDLVQHGQLLLKLLTTCGEPINSVGHDSSGVPLA